MKNRIFLLPAIFISSFLQAEKLQVAEISESCLHDAQQYYSINHAWKYGEFSGLVTDGGGYGIYKQFKMRVLASSVGEIKYEEGVLSVSTSEMSLLVSKIAELCSTAVNKSSKRDAASGAPS